MKPNRVASLPHNHSHRPTGALLTMAKKNTKSKAKAKAAAPVRTAPPPTASKKMRVFNFWWFDFHRGREMGIALRTRWVWRRVA
jgi:hypothetical protein|tara:strand:- start:35754 stop:36005 length:252 start_codon:yes stop_codon:yes gene_type:complete